ncbi:MAG: M48 family metallopeptidase, partial [Bacteroidales bacterium]|nr:M48 family metallopeptidase [Bacteroidales bacterium]
QIIKNRVNDTRNFVEGETFLLFGKKLSLYFNNNFVIPAVYDNKLLINKSIEPNWRKIFDLWYKKTALEFFKKRAFIYSKLLGVNYKNIKISSAQKRWGSCSSTGNINLSWRLVMAPIEVIDYVVIHELAHLIEPNHSNKFWYHVQRIQPEYKLHRKWLKENGYLLTI